MVTAAGMCRRSGMIMDLAVVVQMLRLGMDMNIPGTWFSSVRHGAGAWTPGSA